MVQICYPTISYHYMYPETKMSSNDFVADTVVRSRTNFYFSQQLLQQQIMCKTSSFQGMLPWAKVHAICVATKLQGKLQEKLPSVTASLF